MNKIKNIYFGLQRSRIFIKQLLSQKTNAVGVELGSANEWLNTYGVLNFFLSYLYKYVIPSGFYLTHRPTLILTTNPCRNNINFLENYLR